LQENCYWYCIILITIKKRNITYNPSKKTSMNCFGPQHSVSKIQQVQICPLNVPKSALVFFDKVLVSFSSIFLHVPIHHRWKNLLRHARHNGLRIVQIDALLHKLPYTVIIIVHVYYFVNISAWIWLHTHMKGHSKE